MYNDRQYLRQIKIRMLSFILVDIVVYVSNEKYHKWHIKTWIGDYMMYYDNIYAE